MCRLLDGGENDNMLESLPDYLQPKAQPWASKVEDIYREAVKNNDNETIFKCFHRICFGIVCQKLKNSGLSPEEIQERAMDATIHAMNIRDTPYHKARGGMHYDTLKGWCYLAVINELYHGQQKFEDRLLSLDEHIEEKGEDISWERKA